MENVKKNNQNVVQQKNSADSNNPYGKDLSFIQNGFI